MDNQVDRELSRLVADAVEDVEPSDRLSEIRERTSSTPSRRGWYAAGGAMLAAAAAVTAIAVVANQSGPAKDEPGPATSPPATTPTPTGPGEPVSATPVYYVGNTPHGLRLYREFNRFAGGPGPRAIAGLTSRPADPDYRTLWSDGLLTGSVSDPEAGVVMVFVTEEAHDRPPNMTAEEAELAIEQVIFTLQAVFQDSRLAVQFRLGDNPVDQVLGVPTSEPLAAGAQLDVLALVSITNPAEGREVTGSFVADGRASSFEGTVPWELRDSSGAVVRQGFAMAGMDDHLIPWSTEPIDVSDLEPGSYVFEARTDDAGG
jgi:Immunoglobulin-like domain of bacterial spore germination